MLVEVTLHEAAFFECDLLSYQLAEPINDAALLLSFRTTGIDDLTTDIAGVRLGP